MSNRRKAAAAKPIAPPRWGRNEGPEDLDPTPMELPLGAKPPMTLQEMIAMMVRQERMSEDDGEFETFEDAEDFEPDKEVEEELLDMSPYTLVELDPLEEGFETLEKENEVVLEAPPDSKVSDDRTEESEAPQE